MYENLIQTPRPVLIPFNAPRPSAYGKDVIFFCMKNSSILSRWITHTYTHPYRKTVLRINHTHTHVWAHIVTTPPCNPIQAIHQALSVVGVVRVLSGGQSIHNFLIVLFQTKKAKERINIHPTGLTVVPSFRSVLSPKLPFSFPTCTYSIHTAKLAWSGG